MKRRSMKRTSFLERAWNYAADHAPKIVAAGLTLTFAAPALPLANENPAHIFGAGLVLTAAGFYATTRGRREPEWRETQIPVVPRKRGPKGPSSEI